MAQIAYVPVRMSLRRATEGCHKTDNAYSIAMSAQAVTINIRMRCCK